MLSQIILDYEQDAEVIDQESLFKYDGKKDFSTLRSLEAVADTQEMSLSYLGDLFPSLQKLRLNNSSILSIRDVSASLRHLRFLSLAHCGITSLDGICTLSANLEELYLAFNQISDLSELMGLSKLRVLDLEENRITKITEVEFLSCCPDLRALTLAGNEAADSETYRTDVLSLVPHLIYLDEKRLRPKTSHPQKVTFEPITVDKIPKGEKCGTKPQSAEGIRSEVTVLTEQLADATEGPPTARAYFGPNALLQTGSSKTKKIVTPKLGRPKSSHRATRSVFQEGAALFD
jgi:Leucine-rich repeat (LRR) protein